MPGSVGGDEGEAQARGAGEVGGCGDEVLAFPGNNVDKAGANACALAAARCHQELLP